jgi:bifunctional non-homologous end joining protein LigD
MCDQAADPTCWAGKPGVAPPCFPSVPIPPRPNVGADRKVTDAMLYAFDLLELNGEDMRGLPLRERKVRLERLLSLSRTGIVFNEHTDQDGATVFQHACKLGLEGIVSKRLTAPYRSGPSRDWLKVKNPDSPAMIRAREAEW